VRRSKNSDVREGIKGEKGGVGEGFRDGAKEVVIVVIVTGEECIV